MTHEPNDDLELGAYFDAARKDARLPSQDLLARIMADAQSVQAAETATETEAVQRVGIWTGFLSAIGGWPALGGMVTATVAGVWMGFSPPVGLETIATSYLGNGNDSVLVDLMSGFENELTEG